MKTLSLKTEGTESKTEKKEGNKENAQSIEKKETLFLARIETKNKQKKSPKR